MTPEQTLRERWNIWAKEKNLCTDCTAMSEEFFLAQFDAMLAEDIEKIRTQGLFFAQDILEARREALRSNM